MIRPKIDTRPLAIRIRDASALVSVLRERLHYAETELLQLEAQAGIVRDQHPVKVTGDGGI